MRMLLIEDNDDDAVLIRKKLAEDQESSFDVTHVTTLQAALALLTHSTFDVVLTDLGLPDSTGIETYAKVQMESKNAPVVVLTGTYRDLEPAIEAVRRGAQDYLIKEDLDARRPLRPIRFAIERKQLQRQLETALAERQQKLSEVEHLNRSMMGRETRILELKEEVNDLCGKLKVPTRYGTTAPHPS